MGIPVTAKLRKEDQKRVDRLTVQLGRIAAFLSDLRTNKEVVIRVSLEDRKGDDIQK